MILSTGVIALLILGLFWGFRTGLVLQLITLGMYLLSFLVAVGLSAPLAESLYHLYQSTQTQQPTTAPALLNVVIFALIFFISSAVLWRLGRTINLVTKLPVIHSLNGILGAIVGFLVRYLIVFVILNVLILLPSTWIQQQYAQSTLSQTIVTKTPVISDQLLKQWRATFQSHT